MLEIQTERLTLRPLAQDDFGDLCKIMQDNDTMYAYEGAFTDDEVHEWLDHMIIRYEKYGFSLFAVILKETGELIGQCGLTMQDVMGEERLEVGYLFQKAFWHKGYATEAARAWMDYAFDTLNAKSICSIIRDTNAASQGVAIRNGMTVTDRFVKHYRGIDMPHVVYSRYR